MTLYANRLEAGRALARELAGYAGRSDVVVLALPRGGVPVAREVASALGAPFDVLVVRKVGVPGHAELAMGAIAGRGVSVVNESVVLDLGIGSDEFDRVAAMERVELRRREALYRGSRPSPELANRIVILVDDGLATGATMRAAVASVRAEAPLRVVVAVPVGAAATCAQLGAIADEVVCPRTPEPFFGIGEWYVDFRQTSDDDVLKLLSGGRP
jgi:putative phosphoribosyl transferase